MRSGARTPSSQLGRNLTLHPNVKRLAIKVGAFAVKLTEHAYMRWTASLSRGWTL